MQIAGIYHASMPTSGATSILATGSTFNTQVIALLAAMAIVAPYALRTYRRGARRERQRVAEEASLLPTDADAKPAPPGTTLESLNQEIEGWDDRSEPLTLTIPSSVPSGSDHLPARLALAALADAARQAGWTQGTITSNPDASITAQFVPPPERSGP